MSTSADDHSEKIPIRLQCRLPADGENITGTQYKQHVRVDMFGRYRDIKQAKIGQDECFVLARTRAVGSLQIVDRSVCGICGISYHDR